MERITRRNMFAQSGRLAGAMAIGLPSVGASDKGTAGADRRLKVIVAGGHPDDPESGAGGTMARYADLGHDVVALYLTRGEAGIEGKSHQEAAAIRTAECQKACEILKARPVFAGQVDGSTEISAARYDEFRRIIQAEQPDIVFTQWPIDSHRDHRATSLLAYDAWLSGGRKFSLYYFEVMTGEQTQGFLPNHYVDISAAEPRKRAACFVHASQDPAGFYAVHDLMNRFRGMEVGVKFAEAFICHPQSPNQELP
ncbi:MAG: PIG-L deacetylase family protein [Terriglobia bacterium]